MYIYIYTYIYRVNPIYLCIYIYALPARDAGRPHNTYACTISIPFDRPSIVLLPYGIVVCLFEAVLA